MQEVNEDGNLIYNRSIYHLSKKMIWYLITNIDTCNAANGYMTANGKQCAGECTGNF